MVEKDTTQKMLDVIAQAIFDKKGANILALDLRGLSTMTDYMVIAEGNVDRHLKALGMAVLDAMEQKFICSLHSEGLHGSDWVIIDFSDIVVHLFTPDQREKYDLEELWRAGKIIDLQIIISNEGRNANYV